MSEIIIKILNNSKDKTLTIFLNNNFRFQGKCLDFDDRYLEILDYKSKKIKIIKISEINEIGVSND